MRVEERLLKYVSYWTTSDEECRQIPSSERQFELGKVLEQELRDLGFRESHFNRSLLCLRTAAGNERIC